MKKESLRILIVDDEPEYREVLELILKSNGYNANACESGQKALTLLKKQEYHIVLTDYVMPDMSGMEVLLHVKSAYPRTEVIMITGYGTVQNAVETMRQGAFGYIIKGSAPDEMLNEIEKIRNIMEEPSDDFDEENGFVLKSHSAKFQNVLDVAKKVAGTNINVLLLGESGVGKEIIARYIHKTSQRAKEIFLPVNCQSFPDNLLESELFGHEKGAFTGAHQNREGKFEAAAGGTLFLDEVGDICMSTQIKLLRAIETKLIEKVGSNKPIHLDFRLISATNRDLAETLSDGSFRKDFFYRISSMVIEIPPLRERREDITFLFDFFVQKSAKTFGKRISGTASDVIDALKIYDYPGNVREMRSIAERMVILAESDILQMKNLEESLAHMNFGGLRSASVKQLLPLRAMRREFEMKYIQDVLAQTDYNVTASAEKMDISRRQLFNKIKEYGIKCP